jgi:thioredoxin 1
MQTTQIRDVDAATFDSEVLQAASPVLVDFSAGWCPPCRMIEPVVAELAATYAGRLAVVRLDTDHDPAIAARYGVMGMPTLVLFVEGRPANRLVGFPGAGRVRSWAAGALSPGSPDETTV